MIVSIEKVVDANAPTQSILELLEVKNHLRIPVDEDYDDVYLLSLISAAVEYVEQQLNRKLSQHQVEYYIPKTSTQKMFLPYGNTVITQAQTTERTLIKPADYMPGLNSVIFSDVYEDVTLYFTCGYTTLPLAIKHALLLIIGTMYEVRMDVTYGVQTHKAQFSSEHLLKSFRIDTL